MSVDKMSVDKMSVEKMSVDKMSVDKMSCLTHMTHNGKESTVNRALGGSTYPS
jgi:hypothetical protein